MSQKGFLFTVGLPFALLAGLAAWVSALIWLIALLVGLVVLWLFNEWLVKRRA